MTIRHRPLLDPHYPTLDDRWWEAVNDAGEVIARVPERLFLAMHRRARCRSATEEAILKAILAHQTDNRPEAMK